VPFGARLKTRQVAPFANAAKFRQADAICNLINDEYENSEQHLGVIFYLRKYKATTGGKAPIYARITVNGSRIDISVKRSIDPDNWNANKGMAKGSREEIIKLNNYLQKYRSTIVESYQELLLQKKLVAAELVKNKFSGEDQAGFTLCKLMEFHNREQAQVLTQGTMKNYYT
jgi:hypothetical protein